MEGPHSWIGHCHCDSCRRGAGAPLVTFIGHPNGHWRWTGKTPARYESSPGTFRDFCPTCGSSVAYTSDSYPDDIHFHAVLLDDPGAITPDQIYHADERLPWIPVLPGCVQS
jgi:hypothetical protein